MNYKAKSISKCWEHSFDTFISDMGRRPTPKHQLDRKNNDDGYCKENCRWVTSNINQVNRGLYKGSLPKGIATSGSKFRTYINVDKQQYYIGTFNTIELAIFNRDIHYAEWYGCKQAHKRL